MQLRRELFEIEYLVFSSHKTATQTITRTLNCGGIRAIHGHVLNNIGIHEDQFREYLLEYERRNGRKLGVISTFRDPMDRMISSFFQSLSEDRYAHLAPEAGEERAGEVGGPLTARSPQELLGLFYRYCDEIAGWGESIEIICYELKLSVEDLKFSIEQSFGNNELEYCNLYLFRFDLLGRLTDLIHRISSRRPSVRNTNVSLEKEYSVEYAEFLRSVRAPAELITSIYRETRGLVELFYPNEYDTIVSDRVERYALESGPQA